MISSRCFPNLAQGSHIGQEKVGACHLSRRTAGTRCDVSSVASFVPRGRGAAFSPVDARRCCFVGSAVLLADLDLPPAHHDLVGFDLALGEQPAHQPALIRVGQCASVAMIRQEYSPPGRRRSGHTPGRQSAEEITLYRSLGITAQDLAVAHHVLQAAEKAGRGQVVDF